MADPPLPQPSTDEDLTGRLLGWNSTANNDGEEWKSLHFQVRTTAEGVEAFNGAMKLLRSEEGRIVFNSGDTNGSSFARDPLRVVDAYFRLLRCSLEPIDVANNANPLINEGKWAQVTKELLKSLGGSLKSSLQQQIQLLKGNNIESPHQGTYNRSYCTQRNNTLLLYFRSIIDHVGPHAGHNTTILGSTYKPFHELAELFINLLEMECNKIGKLLSVVGWPAISNVLQQDLDKVKSVWGGLNDCLRLASFYLIDNMEHWVQKVQLDLSGQEEFTSKPDIFSRVVIFTMARVVAMIILRRKMPKIRDVNGSMHSDFDDEDVELVSRCLLLMIKFRSISVLVHGFLDDTSVRGQLDDNHINQFKMLVGLGQKIDVYAVKLLRSDADQNADNDSIRLGLKCLAALPSEELNIVFSIKGNAAAINAAEDVFTLGKLFVIKHILKNIYPSASGVSTTLIRLCESAIFHEMPKFYHLFQLRSPHDVDLPIWACNFISDLVGVLSGCTFTFFLSENGGDSRYALIRQHELLVRWLAGSKGTSGKGVRIRPNHPFSNEIIMYILQLRIVHSSFILGNSRQDRKSLISLMAKLLFHPRTEGSHRRLIATVLTRLLRSSNIRCGWESEMKKTQTATIKIMWRELQKSSVLSSKADDSNSSGKRKRKTNSSNVSSEVDASELCDVLGTLIEASVSSQVPINNAAIQEMRLLWDFILKSSDTSGRSQDSLSTKQLFAMSLLAGMMKCQLDIVSIQSMINDQEVVKSETPSSFIDASLALVGTSLVPGRGKSKIASHYYVCVQFLRGSIQLFGREFSENQVTRVLETLNRINAGMPQRVQHLSVSKTCQLGPLIKPNYSAESVKVRCACSFSLF
jgi:hypothetical protein